MLFPNSSFWQDHSWEIIPLLAMVVVLGLLVFGLLITLRKRRWMEKVLAFHLSFKTMLAELSNKFINLPIQEIDQEIEGGLKRMVEYLGVDRGYLWQFFENEKELIPTHSWIVEGIDPLPQTPKQEEFPWIIERLHRGETFTFSDLDELPDEARVDRQSLLSYGVKSAICIRLSVGGELVGILTLSAHRYQKIWSVDFAPDLRIVGEIFVNALTRLRAREDLQQAYQDYRIVADFNYDWEFWINEDRSMRYVSPSCERISGYKAVEFIERPDLFREIVLPEDRDLWDRHECEVREEPGPREIQFRILRPDGTIRWIEHVCQPVTAESGKFLGLRASNRDITDRKQAELDLKEALLSIEQLKKQLEADYSYLREEIKLEHGFDQIIGKSDALKYVLFNVEQVASSDATVLILGETGTGKELIARAIHSASPRAHRALVKVDCAALSPNIVESELFGHEKGAFTGASSRTVGRFELAHGSTLFLDEVGELSLALQGKLLRLLQAGEFERLGSSQTLKVDVRIIAATNRILEDEVKRGHFREDLWYRLNVFPITLPPLRQRQEDIPLLVQSFMERFAKKLGKDIRKIPLGVMEALRSYSWPGNVRELENVIERAVIHTQGPTLQLAEKVTATPTATTEPLNKSLAVMEKEYILEILTEVDWRIEGENGAAAKLGLNPSTLRGRMRKLGISRK